MHVNCCNLSDTWKCYCVHDFQKLLICLLWKHFTCTVREVISIHFNVHFPDEPVLTSCPWFFLSVSFKLFILFWWTKTFHITFNTIPTCLPMVSVLSNSFSLRNCTTFDLISIILAFSIGSRSSDHYFRSVCLSVCLCKVFLSRLWSDFDQTRTYVICLV